MKRQRVAPLKNSLSLRWSRVVWLYSVTMHHVSYTAACIIRHASMHHVVYAPPATLSNE